ncbi:MAG: head decoration protein [Candidatus Kapabacteria bacterium]|nr:head decoration protein [Candidatus Kapabacteria bacterium]
METQPELKPLVLAPTEPLIGPGTLASGNNLVAGAVLGRITASGKFTAWNPAASNGSQNIAGILVNATNASGADANINVYTLGVFNINALNAGANVLSVGIYNNGTIIFEQEVA